MQGADSLGKTLMLEKIEKRRRQQRMRWLDSITNSVDLNLNKSREIVKDREALHVGSMESQRVGHDLVTEQQQQQQTVCKSVKNGQVVVGSFFFYRTLSTKVPCIVFIVVRLLEFRAIKKISLSQKSYRILCFFRLVFPDMITLPALFPGLFL